MSDAVAIAEPAAPARERGALVLEAKNLERHYQVGRGMFKGSATLQALRGASFEMYAGRTLAVVGESGCGKSTLARLLTLIEEPSAGTLKIDGVDVAHVTGEDQAQAAPEGADRVPGSLRLAQSAQEGREHPGRAAAR